MGEAVNFSKAVQNNLGEIDTPDIERIQGETKRECYKRDRHFGDCIMSEIGLVIGQYGLFENENLDITQNIDIVIRNTQWAIRIRDGSTYMNPLFKNDVSIRLVTGNGNPSEYDKIKSGKGNLMFYGFMNLTREQYNRWKEERDLKNEHDYNSALEYGNTESPHLIAWTILDLNAFRDYVNNMSDKEETAWINSRAKKHNPPDNSACIYVDKYEVPNFVVIDSEQWPQAQLTTWIRPHETKDGKWIDINNEVVKRRTDNNA